MTQNSSEARWARFSKFRSVDLLNLRRIIAHASWPPILHLFTQPESATDIGNSALATGMVTELKIQEMPMKLGLLWRARQDKTANTYVIEITM
jgi:hypothetical protein